MSSRPVRNTINYCQTTYKLEPWGESSWQLPIIIRSTKERKSVLQNKDNKDNNKLSVYYSAQKLKLKRMISPQNRLTPVKSFSYHKKPINPKYNQNFYRPKSIKNMDLMQSEDIKKKVKKKLSKKLQFSKNNHNTNPYSQLTDVSPSRFSSHHNDPATNKAEKRLQLQRKIYVLLSKEKII